LCTNPDHDESPNEQRSADSTHQRIELVSITDKANVRPRVRLMGDYRENNSDATKESRKNAEPYQGDATSFGRANRRARFRSDRAIGLNVLGTHNGLAGGRRPGSSCRMLPGHLPRCGLDGTAGR